MRRIFGKAAVAGAVVFVVLAIWIKEAEREVHYTPEYRRVDISEILAKDSKNLTEEDYDTLFWQTGLGKAGVQNLYRSGHEEELRYLQERFFAEVEVVCENSWGLHCESVVEDGKEQKRLRGNHMPTLEEGDILLTFGSHFLGWRNGHAALVIDGENGLTLEAMAVGCDSTILSVTRWKTRPSFAVLRLRGASLEQREEIAKYAEENLVGIPYDLVAMVGTPKGKQKTRAADGQREVLRGTQCAHLVWCAYAEYGYDLNGGWNSIVTPEDLFYSPLLEIVQIYGMSPEAVENRKTEEV